RPEGESVAALEPSRGPPRSALDARCNCCRSVLLRPAWDFRTRCDCRNSPAESASGGGFKRKSLLYDPPLRGPGVVSGVAPYWNFGRRGNLYSCATLP